MPKKWNVGDVVVLTSGGQDMTVTGYNVTQPLNGGAYIKDDETQVHVTWMVDGLVKRDSFPEDALEEAQ